MRTKMALHTCWLAHSGKPDRDLACKPPPPDDDEAASDKVGADDEKPDRLPLELRCVMINFDNLNEYWA